MRIEAEVLPVKKNWYDPPTPTVFARAYCDEHPEFRGPERHSLAWAKRDLSDHMAKVHNVQLQLEGLV